MLVLLICQTVTALTAVCQPPTRLASNENPRVASHRPFHEISREMRTLLRSEAAADDEQGRYKAVIGLTDLYAEVMQDPRLAESDTLRSYRVKLRSRLLSVEKELQARLDRREAGDLPQLHQRRDGVHRGITVGTSADGSCTVRRDGWRSRDPFRLARLWLVWRCHAARLRCGSRGPDPSDDLARVVGRQRREGDNLLLLALVWPGRAEYGGGAPQNRWFVRSTGRRALTREIPAEN